MYVVELIVKGLVYGGMYAMMAMGLTLVYGLLRILHIAHAGVFTLGAYIGVVVANATGNLLLATALAIVVSGAVGVLIYRWAYQPLLGHPAFVPMIVSIGLFIIMQDGFRLVFGPYGLAFAHNPYYVTTVGAGGITLNLVEVAMVAVAATVLGGFTWYASKARTGIGWRATVTDPQMAESFGVDPRAVRYRVFFFGSALAGIAGVLIGLLNNYVEPTMGAVVSYKTLAIIVLGGLGNVRGTLIASLVLGVVEAFGTIYLSHLLDRDAIGFLFLILALMVRPEGLVRRA
ncbi:MAG: branched-chain amino acid ABC transporter permease [Proteobacteria bacterium]|nr:branched-chain amino acid ABC transporter permease [Pseudomonadota bacterium]